MTEIDYLAAFCVLFVTFCAQVISQSQEVDQCHRIGTVEFNGYSKASNGDMTLNRQTSSKTNTFYHAETKNGHPISLQIQQEAGNVKFYANAGTSTALEQGQSIPSVIIRVEYTNYRSVTVVLPAQSVTTPTYNGCVTFEPRVKGAVPSKVSTYTVLNF